MNGIFEEVEEAIPRSLPCLRNQLRKALFFVTVQPEIAGNLLPSRLVGYLC